MVNETTHARNTDNATKNGEQARKTSSKERVISRPGDVAGLVMMQVDAVNAKKDELTIAIKGLVDTAKQLVRAYADHAQTIVKLQQRISRLEERLKEKGCGPADA